MYSYSISKRLFFTALLAASVTVSATQEDAATSDLTQTETDPAQLDSVTVEPVVAGSADADHVKADSVKLDEAAKATAALIAATLSQHNAIAEDKVDIVHNVNEIKSDITQESAEETPKVQSSIVITEQTTAPSIETNSKDEKRPTQELTAKADTKEVTQTKPVLPVAAMPAPKPAPAAEIASNASISNQMNTQSCPTNFYDVKLPKDGKLCQVFAADLPASMILFVPQTPAQVIEFYQQDSSSFSTSRQVKDRFMLQSTDKNKTLIISADGQGTQIDILVKNINY